MATRFSNEGNQFNPTKRSAGQHRFGRVESDEAIKVAVSSTVTATVTTPADITAKEGLVVVSSADNAYMVRLPAREAGTVIRVYNTGGASNDKDVLIRPPLGGKFNHGTANKGITTGEKTLVAFVYLTTTHVVYDTGATPSVEA